MAKLSMDELQHIIDLDLPGHRVIERGREDETHADTSSSEEVRVEADTPDIEALRRKYLRKKYLDASDESIDASNAFFDNTGDDDGVEIVLVESKPSADPLEPRSQVKAVLVDTRTKKITGAQG